MELSTEEDISLETKFSQLLEEFNLAKAQIEEMKKVKEDFDKQTENYNQLKEDYIKLTKNVSISTPTKDETIDGYKTVDELKNMTPIEAHDYLKEKIIEELKENKD